MAQPGFQHFFVDTIHGRDGAAGWHGLEVIEPARQQTQRHHLADGPYRRQCFAVGGLEMFDERLIRTVDFIGQLVEIDLPEIWLERQRAIQMRVRTVFMSQLISPLTARRYLHAFDRVKHEKAQFAIETYRFSTSEKRVPGWKIWDAWSASNGSQ